MYYAKRNNLLQGEVKLDLCQLKEYFYQIYNFFKDKGYFEGAFYGISYEEKWTSEEIHIMSSLLNPSPEVFFLHHLNSEQIVPIEEFYEIYTEEELFTIIEVLYDKIGYYDFDERKFKIEDAKESFLEEINNILKLYSDGYILEENNGYIMKMPNQAIVELLKEDVTVINDTTIIEQLKNALKRYYRFNSTLEDKKSAIFTLATILEPLREELKTLFGTKIDINKNVHDSMLFEILNRFNIRHDNDKQFKQYNKEIWYDWMVQYYTSVIVTYYKLKIANEEKQ